MTCRNQDQGVGHGDPMWELGREPKDTAVSRSGLVLQQGVVLPVHRVGHHQRTERSNLQVAR